MMAKYVSEFRGQQAFYSLCKMAKDGRFSDPDQPNTRVKYYNKCTQANSVAKAILSKISDKQLVLRDVKLNSGDAMGLSDTLHDNP